MTPTRPLRPRFPPSADALFEAFRAAEASTDDLAQREELLRTALRPFLSRPALQADEVLVNWAAHQVSTPLSSASWRQVCAAFSYAVWEKAFERLEHQPAMGAAVASAMPDTPWIQAAQQAIRGAYPASPVCLLAQWRNTDLMGHDDLLLAALNHPDPACQQVWAHLNPGPLHRHWVGALNLIGASRRAEVLPQVFPALVRRWEMISRSIRERDLDPQVLDNWIREAAWPGLTPEVVVGFQRTLVVFGAENLRHTAQLIMIHEREVHLHARPVLAPAQRVRRRS